MGLLSMMVVFIAKMAFFTIVFLNSKWLPYSKVLCQVKIEVVMIGKYWLFNKKLIFEKVCFSCRIRAQLLWELYCQICHKRLHNLQLLNYLHQLHAFFRNLRKCDTEGSKWQSGQHQLRSTLTLNLEGDGGYCVLWG